MKIIFLNTWNGKMHDGLSRFLKEQARDTDIFCFQEVYDAMKVLARSTIGPFEEFAANKYLDDGSDFFQATYVRKSIPILDSGTILGEAKSGGLGLYVHIPWGSTTMYVVNFHGIAWPGDKLDNPGRIQSSRALIDFLSDKPGSKIIGGDFNILPETHSVRMFTERGYRDLVKEYHVETTRNRLAWELYPNNKQYFSDYVFVDPDTTVSTFSVPNMEISDHLPLMVELGK
jgi:endonuclease/exonuclease/phosphatase family metal-dependent hydrolase